MTLTAAAIRPTYQESATQAQVEQLNQLLSSHPDPFRQAQAVAAQFLGVRRLAGDAALFGFWVPELAGPVLKNDLSRFQLELFIPQTPLALETLTKGEARQVTFEKITLPLQSAGDYLLTVVDPVPMGAPRQDGALYWLVYNTPDGQRFLMRDPLAQSLPLGVYAPAEAYDMAALLANRRDLSYFQTHFQHRNPDGSLRAHPIGTTLEIHPETATEEGTLAALTRQFQTLADKVADNLAAGRAGDDGLTPAQQVLYGFDTVELTPEVPPVEREAETSPTGQFFQILEETQEEEACRLMVRIGKPDISNWGYDTPILGTAAVNPSILETGRPHEFLAFVETLHTFPGRPIQLSFDAVLGHADFQGAQLLATPEQLSSDPGVLKYVHSAYFRGASMYGRDLNYGHPVVRAILLELYRRKVQLGFDCVRVDGGQDFVKTFDPETGFRIQDDDFIFEMVNQTQTIPLPDGPTLTRRLDMNVEDGRPWPNDMNWLYNATYVEHLVAHKLPHGDRVKQWGSLIFAHNVHGKYKWFQTKWDRFKDTFKDGQDWITGHSNHDNARYFYRLVFPKPSSDYVAGESFDDYYNRDLGDSYPQAAHTALDNPALTALALGFLPGSPMFFYNALCHTPWLFFRNIDDQYGVKVVADEGSRFLLWYVDEALYQRADSFPRLKALGFERLSQLVADPQTSQQAFMDILFDQHETIKTVPAIVFYLVDAVSEGGGFETLAHLQAEVDTLEHPQTPEQIHRQQTVDQRIASDRQASAVTLSAALKLLNQLQTQLEAGPANKESAERLAYLLTQGQQAEGRSLLRLLEAVSGQFGYDLTQWGQDERLIAKAPQALLTNGQILPETLKTFAAAFMADAKEACLVSRTLPTLNEQNTRFGLSLRAYRQANPWLARNPVNDVTRDFFNRKLLANGAKNTGAFFSDKGDIVNANTIYYGWRTSPAGDKQVFLLANMEGRPLARLPLADYLPDPGPWRRVVASPGLGDIPEQVGPDLVLTQVLNGQALLLERTLSPQPPSA